MKMTPQTPSARMPGTVPFEKLDLMARSGLRSVRP